MSLPMLRDDCNSAADVLAKAKVILDRRREMFRAPSVAIKPMPSIILAELRQPPRKIQWAVGPEVIQEVRTRRASRSAGTFQWSVALEVARQLGIPPDTLKGGSDAKRTIPLTQYRQLAVALALHLTGKSCVAIGKSFDLDHTCVMHARTTMAPIIATVNMTADDSLAQWVAASLPYLFVYIEYLRRERRNLQARNLRNQSE